jgi:hypothetical protein
VDLISMAMHNGSWGRVESTTNHDYTPHNHRGLWFFLGCVTLAAVVTTTLGWLVYVV